MIRNVMFRLWLSFSPLGLVLGTLFFAASLTPTLIPRIYVTQGVLSGCAMAAGYGMGVFGRWLARYLELPGLKGRPLRLARIAAAAGCTAVVLLFLWKTAEWQNSIRAVMSLPPVDSIHPLEVGLVALLTFLLLLGVARLFLFVLNAVAAGFGHVMPRRVSNVIALAMAVLIFWSVANGLIFRFALHLANSSFRELDALIEPEQQQPADPAKTGSKASLIGWEDLGRAGREYIASGPTKAELSAFSGRPAQEPVRVYVGLNAAETTAERARLALSELKRTDAFKRSVLVIVMPTGTGWVDPAAMDTVEFLHNGDVASVALQYSYLTSWLSLLVEPGYGGEAARDLFAEVYGYWTTLPRDSRPRLYLHGLSLGSMSSELSAELFEVMADPYQGALWSGPPFTNRIWNAVTRNRNPGSPEWLPRFRDGAYVRFTSQRNALSLPGAHWGPMRIIYLQYASDPVTFFDYHSLYREPDWMRAPRGPDVSPELRWYPVVTFLQLLLDMATATTSPMGHGHVYAPEHYIDAWVELTDPQGWNEEDISRLKTKFSRN